MIRRAWGVRRKTAHRVDDRDPVTALCGHRWEDLDDSIPDDVKTCRACLRLEAARAQDADLGIEEDRPEEIRPQEGPQEMACRSPADIIIYGGQAGGGKSFWLVAFEALRGYHTKGFTAVLFRREIEQHTRPGGLWAEAQELYPKLGIEMVSSPHMQGRLPGGGVVAFLGLQHETDTRKHQGGQYCMIGFDEGTHFTEKQFWYMTSRNRSKCGIRPYIRMTCNPDPDSFVASLIAWWIDQETGYPLDERMGVIRWFVRIKGVLSWFDSYEEARDYSLTTPAGQKQISQRDPRPMAEIMPKSLTFIRATLDDNPALLDRDPDYRGWIESLPTVEHEQLGRGNWKIRPAAGLIFSRASFAEVVDQVPPDTVWVRAWDKAGTQDGGKWTAGVLLGWSARTGLYYVADVVRGQWGKANREAVIKQTADSDSGLVNRWQGRRAQVSIEVEQEPGSGGKDSAEDTLRMLDGHAADKTKVTGEKADRWKPFASASKIRSVVLVAERPENPWHKDFLDELHNVTGLKKGEVCDQADAVGLAYNKLAARKAKAAIYGPSGSKPKDPRRPAA